MQLTELWKTPRRVLETTERLAAATTLSASLEHLALPSAYEPGGFNEWRVLRENFTHRWARSVGDVVYRPRVVKGIHCIRAVAAAVQLSPVSHRRTRLVAGWTLTGTQAVLAPLHHNGGDGSDQASFATQGLASIARSTRDPYAQQAVIWTIAGQAVLAYLTSGWVKVWGEPWRTNKALMGVMRTRTYGSPHVWRLLKRFPALSRAGEIGTLVLECGYPVVYVLPPKARYVFIGAIAGMHASIAASMGLGRFFSAFLSLQPAVLYTASLTRGTPRPLRGGLWPYLAVLGAGMATVSLVQGRRDRRIAAEPGAGQVLTTMISGSVLATTYRPGPSPKAPLLVFENSLVASQEYWQPILSQLCDYATLTYDRPGYGASRAPSGTEVLATYAEDLSELIEKYRQNGPVWLVGHSMGGHLLARHHHELRTPIEGVVLLDPTVDVDIDDPEDDLFTKSGAMFQSFTDVKWSLRLGWGPLLRSNVWNIQALGKDQPSRLGSIYRTPMIWEVGSLEWRRTLTEISRGIDAWKVQPVPTPGAALVVSAVGVRIHRNRDNSKHQELAKDLGGEQIEIRATHEGVLTAPAPVQRVAELITATVERNR